MKFRKARYNIICLFLAILTLTVVAFKVGLGANMPPDSNTDDPDTNIVDPYPPDDDFSGEPDKNLPSARYPNKLLNYCIQKMQNAAGYYEDVLFLTTIEGEIEGLKASGQLKASGNVIKSGDERCETMSFVPLDAITKRFSPQDNEQVHYMNGQKGWFFDTPVGSHDLNDAICTVWTPDNNPKNCQMYYDFLYRGIEGSYGYSGPIEFTNKCATTTPSLVKNPSTGREEYIITVKMIDANSYPDAFLRSFNSFSKQLQIKTFEQTVVFTIDAETGWIKNFVKTDVFAGGGRSGVLDLNAKFTLSFTATYSHHGQLLEITHPEFPPE